MIRHRFAASLAFLLAGLFASDAFACKCVGDVNPNNMVIGFHGTVQAIEPKGAIDRVTFSVDQQYRGEEESTVKVHASRFHHDCGIRFEQGKSYVVYAYDFRPRGVATSQCWYTYQRDDAPSEEEFSRPDLKLSSPTDLEKQIRKIARDPVEICGKVVRVTDAGFSLILSPDGDPVPAEVSGPINNRDKQFQQCVIEKLIGELPRPEEKVRIEGWYQAGDDYLPVLIDELPCDEECSGWADTVQTALFDVAIPLDESLARSKALSLDGFGTREAQLDAARALCPFDGLEAARGVADSGNAPPADSTVRARMLLECALTRGEFTAATENLSGLPHEVLAAAVQWAAANGSTENPYPIRASDPTFPQYWFDNNNESAKDNHRVLRSDILRATDWSNRLVFLEAFAEAIVADEKATPQMKDYAALAYEKAARLRPASSDAYMRFANGIEKSPNYGQLLGKLDEAFKNAQLARDNEKAELAALEAQLAAENAAPEEEFVEEKGGLDPLMLALGGLVLVVIAAGAFQRFKS